MKLVIEGMDGAGKSTVAKEVARRINAKYVDGLMLNLFYEKGFSESEIEIIKRAIDVFSDNKNSVIRTWIYGFANIFNMLHYETDVVIDRHCLTTYYYNADNNSRELYKYMQKYMGKPDYVIILCASEQTRRARICNRNLNDPDLLSEKKMRYGYDEMKEAARYLELNYQVIDTDNKTIEQVVEEVINIVKGG